MKLRSHLVLLIVVAIIPAVAVSAVALYFFAAQTKTTVETSLVDTARALSLAVERDVRSTVSALHVLAGSADLKRGDLRAFHEHAAPVLRAWPAWDNLVVLDLAGQELVDPSVRFGAPLPKIHAPRLSDSAMRAGFAVSEVGTGPVTSAATIAVQVPVSIDGEIRYMLAASLRTDALADLLTEQRVPAGTVGTLVDRNKIVLARTGGGERAVGQPAPSDLADNVSEMAEGHFSTVRGEGQPVFVAFSTSPVTGWTIALSTPRDALSQPFESSLKLFGGGALLVISLGVVVALMLSRRVSSSLRSLASAAAAMNSGAPVRVPRSRVQEVKAIGEALLAVHRERERSEEHRALLLADAEHRRRAAESLNDVKALVSESLEPESVAQAVVNAMARLLGAPMVVLYRTDPDSSDLVLVSEVGAPERRGWHIPRATGTVAMALETGTPVQSADVLTDPRITLEDRLRADIERSQYRAAFAVPLMVRGTAIGSLMVGDGIGRIYADEEIDLAQTFAHHAAIAMNNARLYQELRAAYDKLSVAQQQLLQAQKMEAVGRLAGGIAHDFNNLITVISGRSVMLMRELGPDHPSRRKIEIIQSTADRAADITRQLLAFSRKQLLAPKRLNVNEQVRAMLPVLERLLGEDITVTFLPDVDSGTVLADPAQIDQVLVNLLVNARDAMPRGGRIELVTANVSLTRDDLGAESEAVPGPYVMLSVQDTGEGMDAATLERIFEPFFTTKAMNRGTGLGLATVYGIIKQSGGQIVVDSQVGLGTTFRIYLPSVAADVRPDAPGPNGIAAGGRETILIVEDEPDVSEFARDALVLYGYTVLSATSPNEALAIARRHRDDIDVVLTDVVMPGMSGRELANRIAEICPRARVAYMSGYTEDAIVRRGVHSAEIPFIAKPFTADSLAHHLRTVLDGEPVAAGR